MSLRMRATLLQRDFDVDLGIAPGETVAVLGPNGAGKSTLLGVLAGLVKPDSGEGALDGDVLFDLGGPGPRRWSAPHRRGVALLAQDALLFPHLSVRENVAFGPRSTGASARDSRVAADRWLQEVDAADLAARSPGSLSGGQAQRVAVARALAAEPRLLLLDEPLSALDAAHTPALRRTLRRVLADRTAVIVTHDILDAYTLADRVVVMDSGRIVDSGPTRAVLDRPSTAFTAGLAALNLLTGIAAAPRAGDSTGGLASVVLDDGTCIRALADVPLAPGAPAAVAVRPSRVTLGLEAPTTDVSGEPGATDARSALVATVTDLEPHGDTVRVRTDRLSADVSPGEAAALDLAPGIRVTCSFAPADALAYPR